jgi:tetratricopeptide (TPR) repeat protein
MHKNLESCKPCVEWCQEKYKNGAIFSYFEAQYYRKLGEGIKAVENLEHAIKVCDDLKIPPNLFNWDLANCYFMCLDWENASKVLEKILQSTGKKKDFEFNSLCTLQLACSYQLMGEEKKAIAILKKVPEAVTKKGRYDKMALRKAQSILNLNSEDMGTAMYSAAFELLYFKRDIAHMLEEHLNQVQKHMQKLSSKVDIKKIKKEQMAAVASCLVIEGAVLRGLKKNDEAKKTFEKALTM